MGRESYLSSSNRHITHTLWNRQNLKVSPNLCLSLVKESQGRKSTSINMVAEEVHFLQTWYLYLIGHSMDLTIMTLMLAILTLWYLRQLSSTDNRARINFSLSEAPRELNSNCHPLNKTMSRETSARSTRKEPSLQLQLEQQVHLRRET